MSLAIAGAGPVAQAFGKALAESGFAIACVASRDPEHAKAAAAFIGGGVAAVSYREIASHAPRVLIAVSDRAIAPVAEEIARGGALEVALHTCGSYGPEPLAPLAARGASCGAIHPLQTILDPAQGASGLRNAAFSVCGDAPALKWAEELAETLSGKVLHIDSGARHLYHAAAVMTSNYMAALLDSAEQLMMLAGVPKADALPALAPLARASLENILRCGAAEALTGPIVRGDAATVAEHTAALCRAESSIAELYKAAGLHALDVARKRGLDAEQAERVRLALVGL